ncbi:MAG: response regulator transcription factor [Anaerolineales bacterium]|nr:response regulator transcription factor [Anaerolineales bacterium]
MDQKILIVDDEARLLNVLEAYLQKEGFHVLRASNGQEALNQAAHTSPDLIVLDIMMPVMNGLEFMRIFCQTSQAPIIMLTARVSEEDIVIGLELGADDYMIKPFQPRELLARIRAVLRRTENQRIRPQKLRFNGIALHPDRRQVEIEGTFIPLTPSEYNLLAVLMSAPQRVFSRLELLEATQGEAFQGYERTIDTHIKNLRNKIESDPGQPNFITTVYGAGYRFEGE